MDQHYHTNHRSVMKVHTCPSYLHLIVFASGMNVLYLPSNYLGIDWRNNPKEDGHVDITVKDMTVRYLVVTAIMCAHNAVIQESYFR